MGSSLRSRVLGSLLCLSLLAPSLVSAQTAEDRATARLLAQEADKKNAAKDFKGAFELYKKAFDIVPAPTLKLEMGRDKVQLGELVEAQQLLLDASRSAPQPNEPASFAQARDTAAREAAALTPRIATLEISVEGPAPEKTHVTVDGEALRSELLGLPRALNPGTHAIKVDADGFSPETRSITLAEAEKQKLAIKMTAKAAAVTPIPSSSASPLASAPPTSAPTQAPPPAPSQGSSTGKTLALVGFIGGGVFAVVGGVTGLMSKSKVDSLKKDSCQDHSCYASASSDADSAKTLGWISTGGFALAGVGVAVGVVGLVMNGSSKKESASSHVELGVGPGSIAVGGSF